jgi:hypothetical protein
MPAAPAQDGPGCASKVRDSFLRRQQLVTVLITFAYTVHEENLKKLTFLGIFPPY